MALKPSSVIWLGPISLGSVKAHLELDLDLDLDLLDKNGNSKCPSVRNMANYLSEIEVISKTLLNL